MYKELYDYLDVFENMNNDEIFEQIFFEWSDNQIEATIDTLFQLIKYDTFSNFSVYNYQTNTALSGGPHPCAEFNCRINSLQSLLRFSAFYAEKVMINSPIDDLFYSLHQGDKIDRYEFATCIMILLKVKPFVQAGIVGFQSNYMCLCPDCIKKIVKSEQNYEEELKYIFTHLKEDLIKNLSCEFQYVEDGESYIKFSGAYKYGFNHDGIVILEDVPKELYLHKMYKKYPITLSKGIIEKIGLAEDIIYKSINDVYKGRVLTDISKSSYLTNIDIEADIINTLINNGQDEQKKIITNSIFNNMMHSVPLIQNATLDSVLKVRLENEDEFANYRNSISKILKNTNYCTDENVNDIYSDIIYPDILKIENKIKKSKKALINEASLDVLVLSAAVSIGLYSGMLDIDYASLIGLIGGTKTISNEFNQLKKIITQEEIKNDNYYFLWKVGKKCKLL